MVNAHCGVTLKTCSEIVALSQIHLPEPTSTFFKHHHASIRIGLKSKARQNGSRMHASSFVTRRSMRLSITKGTTNRDAGDQLNNHSLQTLVLATVDLLAFKTSSQNSWDRSLFECLKTIRFGARNGSLHSAATIPTRPSPS